MGRPTVVVTTDAFMDLARASARRSGLSEARIAAVIHPIGGVAVDELRARGQRLVDTLISLFS